LSKKSGNNSQNRDRKAGDLNRKSTHKMRSDDGMSAHGNNPHVKMMGLSRKVT
jgi:protein involved in polysaccharide export with SLBB domain